MRTMIYIETRRNVIEAILRADNSSFFEKKNRWGVYDIYDTEFDGIRHVNVTASCISYIIFHRSLCVNDIGRRKKNI